MSAIGRRTEFDELKAAAENGQLSIAETFAAMREKRITEEEGKSLLNLIQSKMTPRWHRMLSS